jgi:hypothetical protein
MKTNARPAQAPESYATFWEAVCDPIAVDPTAPAVRTSSEPTAADGPTAPRPFDGGAAGAPVPPRADRV